MADNETNELINNIKDSDWNYIVMYDVNAGEFDANKWTKHLSDGGGVKILETERNDEIPIWEVFEIGFKINENDKICFGIRPQISMFLLLYIYIHFMYLIIIEYIFQKRFIHR